MKKDELIIRSATAADLPAAHDLVRELADYEKALHEVLTTPDVAEQDMKAGWFDLYVADYRGEIIGIAWGHRAYSTWKGRMYYLDDLVVREQYRGYGIGRLLLEAIAAHARISGAKLMKWQVLDWNEPAIHFYRKLNACIETDWWNVKLSLTEGDL